MTDTKIEEPTLVKKSVWDFAIPNEKIIHSTFPTIAPDIPLCLKKMHYFMKAETLMALVDKIGKKLKLIGVNYSYCEQKFCFLLGNYKCILRIYQNEGIHAMLDKEGFVVEEDNCSRELHHSYMYWNIREILQKDNDNS